MQHVGFAELDRHRASVGQQVHQPFRRHALDSFAQGGARDLQELAQLALVEFGAGGDATFDKHRAQVSRHLVMKGAAYDLNDLRHAGGSLKMNFVFTLYSLGAIISIPIGEGSRDAPSRFSSQRPSFPADSGPQPRARSPPEGNEPADDRSSGSGIWRSRAQSARRHR